MHRGVRKAIEHRRVHLLHEDALTTDGVDRDVCSAIAGRRDHYGLGGDAGRPQGRHHELGLQQGERAAAGGQA